MDTFLMGFLIGMAAGPLLVIGLIRLSPLAFMKRQLRRVKRWTSGMFWGAIRKLADYLDGLLATRREREAGEPASPNLVGPINGGAASYGSSTSPE
jgi:hypothetical protein